MIRHIVMWTVRGGDPATHAGNVALVKREFESLRGRVPGLLQLDIGVDVSRVDYACDVVLVSDFANREALAAYAEHPEHQRVRRALGDLRSARHQVDYELPDRSDPARPGLAIPTAVPVDDAQSLHHRSPPTPEGDNGDVQAV